MVRERKTLKDIMTKVKDLWEWGGVGPGIPIFDLLSSRTIKRNKVIDNGAILYITSVLFLYPSISISEYLGFSTTLDLPNVLGSIQGLLYSTCYRRHSA